jgi:PLP dependent protein
LLHSIKQKTGAATLVAVSKYQSDDAVLQLYDEGQRVFAESKAQDLAARAERFPKDIEWHFIGHLQTNKIKQVVPYATLIHSIDSEKLLYAIEDFLSTQTGIITKKTDVLLQIKIAEEDSKYGFSPNDLSSILTKINEKPLANVRILGFMGMATNTEDEAKIRAEFKVLNQIFQQTKLQYFENQPSFNTLSMGMSSDFEIAIQEGSTMVRIGSLLFP